MAAVYVDEEEIWKCPKHPSKRRKSGICPVCLRERLLLLCPDCANVRPCGCCTTTSSSSSSSSSSRFPVGADGVRVSKLLESEPSFRRSRSVAIPFLRSTSRFLGGGVRHADFDSGGDRSEPQSAGRTKTPSFWSSMFRSSHRSKRTEANGEYETTEKKVGEIEEIEDDGDAMRRTMMRKSRSVAVPMMSSMSGAAGGERPPRKGRGWYFPSPMKAFRHSRISKIDSERSPVYRG